MANIKKKPTAKEMASAIIEINHKVNETMNVCKNLDTVFGLYIKMKGELEKFNQFIEKEMKEKQEKDNESKADGNADKPDIQGDTDGESSGSKRIRKKK